MKTINIGRYYMIPISLSVVFLFYYVSDRFEGKESPESIQPKNVQSVSLNRGAEEFITNSSKSSTLCCNREVENVLHNSNPSKDDVGLTSIKKDIYTDEEEYSDLEKQEHLEYLDKAIKLSDEKSWDEFIQLLDSPSHENEKSLTVFLIQAIFRRAPLEVILDIVNRGALFTSDVYRALVFTDDTNLIELLRSYGLDIYMVDSEGRNGIFYSVQVLSSRQVFMYLIESGVDVLSSGDNDALYYVLSQCQSGHDVNNIIKILIDKGAKIYTSHQSLINSLKISKKSCFLDS